jgi:hypothetical protein
MASTSPYSPNDYQAVSNYRPYELPINDIFKAITAQNQFWDDGARRIKSVRDDALGLDLTLDANKEIKRKFMEDADKQLTKLSTMDVSLSSVQRQGFDLFKPLFKDEGIIYDDFLTKTLKTIYSDADRYRNMKLSPSGRIGEGYSDRNLAYSLDGFEKFNKNTPRDINLLKNLKTELGNRNFTPYYDHTQEYSKIINNCHGSSTIKQDVPPSSLYFDESSKTGANSLETTNCFMMGLSEQAKQQIAIDGWAFYRGSKTPYEDLANDHYSYRVGFKEKQLNAIKGQIAGMKDGTVTEEEKILIKQLEDMIPEYEAQIKSAKTEYDGITGGNGIKFATDNFRTLSGGAYLQKTFLQLGEAFKQDKTSRKLTANASEIAVYNHQARKEEIRLKAQLEGKGSLITSVPIEPNVTGEDTGQDYNENRHNIEEGLVKDKYTQAYESLKGYITKKDPSAVSGRVVDDVFMLNYADQQSKKAPQDQDPRFKQLMTTFSEYKEEYEGKVFKRQAINETVMMKHPELANKSTSIHGVNLTFKELSAIKGGSTVKGISWQEPQITYGIGKDNVTGRYKVPGGYAKQGESKLEKDDTYEKTLSQIQVEKDKLYAKSFYEAQRYVTPSIDIKEDRGVQIYINSMIGRDKPDEKNGYHLFGHSKEGKDLIVFPLDGDGKEVTNEKDIDGEYKKAYKTDPSTEKIQIGPGRWAIRLVPRADILPNLPNTPDIKQLQHIDRLRDFMTSMEGKLRGSYASSEDLRDANGTYSGFRYITIKPPYGSKIRVKAELANGVITLTPSIEQKDGVWVEYPRSFNSPEELILKYGELYNPQSR